MMTRATPITLVLSALLSAGLTAQEQLGSAAPQPTYRAGWTLTPIFGFSEMYDNNISLFGRDTAEQQNDDYISTIYPGGELHYGGKHTVVDAGYHGSFLNYRTFSLLNRWDQRARLEVKRQETARLKWGGRASMARMPTTDLIELAGIPYRNTGAKNSDIRGSVEYALSAKNSLSYGVNYQVIEFDRSEQVRAFLRGGRVFEARSGWRHKLSSRMAIGADYSYRRALVVDDPTAFDVHATEAALDYELSPQWAFSGGAGIVHLQATPFTEAKTGPAWRLRLERERDRRTFHVGYLRSYIPSFGFGGTIQSQELGVGYRTPLFHSRRFYLDNSAVFRDSDPLTSTIEQLPLRSLRTHSVLGWQPQPWLQVEGFYSRVQQNSRTFASELSRNRIGFQIVTSKPLRMQ
jgi:hypothetical protein